MQSERQQIEQGKLDARLLRFQKAGYTRQEMADALGVKVRTVIRWAKRLGLTRGSR